MPLAGNLSSEITGREMKEDFLGYGNPKGKFWFIGPEEAGSYSDDRYEVWNGMAKGSVLDLKTFHNQLSNRLRTASDSQAALEAKKTLKDVRSLDKLFRVEGAVLQRTWKPLIRLLLRAKGSSGEKSLDALRSYQVNEWGRALGETCLLEIQGGSAARLSKEESNNIERRTSKIKHLLEEHRPRLVVLYGDRVLKHCSAICAEQFHDADLHLVNRSGKPMPVKVASSGRAIFLSTPHPQRHGLSNLHWDTIGNFAHQLLGAE